MRKTYIDNIKWITVVLVVIYHVIYIFNGITVYGIIGPFYDFQPQDVFQYIVYPWFMLILFIISGMSARYDLEKRGAKEFIRVRTVKFLVPSTIGLFVGGWILGYYNMIISNAFAQMGAVPKPILYLIMSISGCGPLWYIQMLWLFSVILVWIRKFEKDKLYNLCKNINVPIILAFVIIIYASAQILNTPVVVVYRFGIYGVGFLIGYFVFSHDEVMEKVGRSWIIFTALSVISCIMFVVMYWGKIYADQEVLKTVVCNVYAWFGSMGMISFMKKWGNFKSSFSEWMNKKSWGLYIFHYLPIAMSAWYLTQPEPVLAPVLIYILVAIAGFFGAYILNEVVCRIPVLRWCLLGIETKKSK